MSAKIALYGHRGGVSNKQNSLCYAVKKVRRNLKLERCDPIMPFFALPFFFLSQYNALNNRHRLELVIKLNKKPNQFFF